MSKEYEVLSKKEHQELSSLPFEVICNIAYKAINTSKQELSQKKRPRIMSDKRAAIGLVLFYIYNKYYPNGETKATLNKIGKSIGVNHSTVAMMDETRRHYQQVQEHIESIKKEIRLWLKYSKKTA